MRTVYKYKLERILGPQVISLPGDALPLKIMMLPDGLFLWAEVTPGDEMTNVIIHIIGTGFEIEDDIMDTWFHLETVCDGPFIWHIYFEHPIENDEYLGDES